MANNNGQLFNQITIDQVKPCDNFFEYACNNWIIKNQTRDSNSVNDDANIISKINEQLIENVLG